MVQSFRLPKRLDYIKLPCLNRGLSGQLSAKYLGTSIQETIQLRSQLIHSAACHFKPDLLLIDKKPTGLESELMPTLEHLKAQPPYTKTVLLLRDILDTPHKTIQHWKSFNYSRTIRAFYDQIMVMGMRAVFDLAKEYALPADIAAKVTYCGYIRKPPDRWRRERIRQQLGLGSDARLVLVTPGGGEDGYLLVKTYLHSLQSQDSLQSQCGQSSSSTPPAHLHSVIFCGPEMPMDHQSELRTIAASCPQVTFQSFSDNLSNYLQEANVVVSMGGYNTLTEIVTAGKRAVVIPRIHPSKEQLLRAQRFSQRGLVTTLHPLNVTPRSLRHAVIEALSGHWPGTQGLDFNGLPQLTNHLADLMQQPQIAPSARDTCLAQ